MVPASTRDGRPDAGPILIADDDDDVRRLFAAALHRAGFETLQARDGRQALDILSTQACALVLLDKEMPLVGGMDVLANLRSRSSTRALPVILVTGDSADQDRVSGLEAGANDFLSKPFSVDELLARVRAQLRARADWTEVLNRGLLERRALAEVLRDMRIEQTPERTAQKMVDELSGVLGDAYVRLFHFTKHGGAIPLAVRAGTKAAMKPGDPLPVARSRYLRERSAEGPWMQQWTRPSPRDDYEHSAAEAGIRAAAYAPLRRKDGVVGLVEVGLIPSATASPTEELAQRFPVLLDFADFACALLGSGLEETERAADARSVLEGIISGSAFTPVYQPIVELETRRIVGCEALTRFRDGVAPDRRFAQAAALGVGAALEMACLHASVAAARKLSPDLWLCLNVSPSLILNGDALPTLIAEAGRPVVLELTEHTPVDDYPALRAAIGRLGASVRISIDDAGAGFASLRHILEAQPHFVKLDIALIRGIENDATRQAMVAGMAYFAQKTNCHLIAEGIETEAEQVTVKSLSVSYGQGYLLGRPAPTLPAGV